MSETLDSGTKQEPEASQTLTSDANAKKGMITGRAEIDTSPPFESVKEAVTRFGGSAVWKTSYKLVDGEKQDSFEEVDIAKVKEQAVELEKDLIVKERETLEVLKELESTKRIVGELKLKLQNETSETIRSPELNPDSETKASEIVKLPEPRPDSEIKESEVTRIPELSPESEATNHSPVSPRQMETNLDSASPRMGAAPPGLILMELKQAKVNLSRTTSDLVGIRASVESLNKKREKEKVSLEKTRERLALSSAKITVLEEELNRTRLKLQSTKDAEITGCELPQDITKEIDQLSSEAEQFKKMAEAAKSEVCKTMAEIEQTKTSIRTAEIRWHAAKKMQEASRAAEAVALAEIRALTTSENSSTGSLQKSTGVTLSFEEYAELTRKAQEAEELSRKRIGTAVLKVDEADMSRMAILKKIEKASEEVKVSKKALEEALNRVEAANRGKLAVEEALRKWRSENGQRRRSVHNSTKFKNCCPSHHRRDSGLLDVNGLNMANDGSKSVLKPTLSIGQILSRKLMLPEEFDCMPEKSPEKQKVSLGQMLNKRTAALSSQNTEKESVVYKKISAKRKKFGLARISHLLAHENKKKKKPAPSARQR